MHKKVTFRSDNDMLSFLDENLGKIEVVHVGHGGRWLVIYRDAIKKTKKKIDVQPGTMADGGIVNDSPDI